MIVGMDFGTTNSGMAVYDGRSVNIIPLDPANSNPRVARTALYITNEQQIYIGRDALNRYFEQNVGRPVKTKKVWIGEIEIRGADMHYVTDVFVYVDVFSPGRLLLSIKTSLRDSDYPGTVIGQHYYSLENLIGLYLNITKTRAEQHLGRPLNQVVLGRPVRFATDPEKDRLAQARLLQAAFQAGYQTVYLQKEPIAAAYSYEASIKAPQNVLVFDFGGGTLDLTVMRLGERVSQRVLATGGIPVAGDVFDQKLVRAKLPRHFGEGSYFGPRHKALTIPSWIYDSFSSWQTILELQTAENKTMLRDIAQTAQRRYQIEALGSLVSSNYGLQMFDIVEQAKRTLSEKRGATITLEGPGFKVQEFVTRTEFETIIRAEIQAIDAHIEETMAASGLKPARIDAVIRTGGSSQVPAFDEMLQRKFGPDKVRRVNTFSSVTAGLGIFAQGVAAGTETARAYIASDFAPAEPVESSRPRVSPANIEILRRRIQVQEGIIEAEATQSDHALVVLGEGKVVTAVPLPNIFSHRGHRKERGEKSLRKSADFSLAELALPDNAQCAITAAWDEPLLILTSKFRFLLLTPRQLAEYQVAKVTLNQVFRLEKREVVSTVARWREIKQQEKLLLVTSAGLARPYPTRVMIESIEAPVPLMFDQPLPGVPIFANGSEGNEELLLFTRSGKALRTRVGNLRGSGSQLMNVAKGDRVETAVLAQPKTLILLITSDGYGRQLLAEWLHAPEKANDKGKSVIARRSDLIAAVPNLEDTPIYLLTTQRLLKLGNGRLPLDESSKTSQLLKLHKNETILTVITVQ
ncbi:Hsp70 family protein [Candidatus Leptofilum sp.]|uniref:Hsp70 family protein n=1 Tax=Candidatus Leptofilum sp. TaxID=3241576 RepID=UPI003B5B7F47